MKLSLLSLGLIAAVASAQTTVPSQSGTVNLPAQTVKTAVSGNAGSVSVTLPAQTVSVKVPASQITVTVPVGATSVNVSVPARSMGYSAAAAQATVTAGTIPPVSYDPSIGGFSPAAGPVGSTVTITGTGFTGTTVVKMGEIADGAFTVPSASTILYTVPADAQSGQFTVGNGTNWSTGPDAFKVMAGTTPTCTGSAPASTTTTQACPTGYTGSWQQTTTYACVGTTWTPSTAPASAPAGACTPVVTTCPPPQPPPSTASIACPPGTTGTWPQTTTYACVGTTWTPSVSPTSPPTGSCPTSSGPPPTANIVIDVATVLAPIVNTQLGTNYGDWFDLTTGSGKASLIATGARFVRWPGGSNADSSNWQTQAYCNGAFESPGSTYANFMKLVAIPAGVEVAATVNYGSNPPACNAGGTPALAAAWVANAKANGHNVHHWTVGNEVYGGWEYDLHKPKNDPTTYANAMSGTNGFYALMKAADPTAQIGIVLNGVPPDNAQWDSTVLSKAPFDFVEIHYYAQQPGSESDSWLLNSGPADITSQITAIRGELKAAGKPASTPILVGELNSVAYNQGKQTLSIVNALWTGMVFGELLNDNVPMITYWFGYGGGCGGGSGSNNSSSLYGWQDFGAYDEVSSGWGDCSPSGGLNFPTIPDGTVMPNGRAGQLVSEFAIPGGSVLKATVTSLPNVRAYGASTPSGGYNAMLFNLSQTATTSVTLAVANGTKTTFTGSTLTYGKAQYDNSKSNVWTPPVSASLGSVSSPLTLTLPPWSMTVVKLQ